MGSALFDATTLESGEAGMPPDGLRIQVVERLAAHRGRRNRQGPDSPVATPRPQTSADDSRAARIAATVAERYRNSPSYRAVLAAEAERAVQQARAAADVAEQNAQAIAEARQQLLETLRQSALLDDIQEQCGEVEEQRAAVREQPQPEQVRDAQPARRATLANEPMLLWPEPSLASTSDRAKRVAVTGPSQLVGPIRATRANRQVADAASLAGGLTIRPFQDSLPATAFSAAAPWHPGPRPGAPLHEQNDSESRALDEEIAFRHAPVFEEPAGPPLPLPANLIEFPRQLVAPRKARPRHAEGPLREEDGRASADSQLRIFEVDPAHISTTPDAFAESAQPWNSIWLDAPGSARDSADAALLLPTHSVAESGERSASAEQIAHSASFSQLQPAKVSRRLLAAAVDSVLLLGAFLAFVVTASATIAPSALHAHLGGLALLRPVLSRSFAPAAAAVLVFLYLSYHLLFFTFSESTPGMRCARIALCTFGDENPTRPAMRRRILAVVVSAIPCALGLLWVALDEDRLAWHDRITRIYQRSY